MNQETKMSLRIILTENKLTGKNYLDWERNLRIVLRQERKLYVIDEDPPAVPDENATEEDTAQYDKYLADAEDVSCLILASISPELQKHCENRECWDMILHLSSLFKKEARQEKYDISKRLYNTKLTEGSPVGEHVIKLLGYHEQLTKIGRAHV